MLGGKAELGPVGVNPVPSARGNPGAGANPSARGGGETSSWRVACGHRQSASVLLAARLHFAWAQKAAQTLSLLLAKAQDTHVAHHLLESQSYLERHVP